MNKETKEKELNYLTKLFAWAKPGLFEDEDIVKVTVKWFCYYSHWRSTLVKVYKTGRNSETLSSDPVCKFIVDKCFDKTCWGDNYKEIDVLPPSGHEGVEAILELADLLELDYDTQLFS